MYEFKVEKKDDFLQGKKINYVARQVGMSESYLSNILNGKFKCSRKIAVSACAVQQVELKEYFNEELKGE